MAGISDGNIRRGSYIRECQKDEDENENEADGSSYVLKVKAQHKVKVNRQIARSVVSRY